MKQRRVLIVTLNDINCGNRLQNFSSVYVFKKLFKCECRTLKTNFGGIEFFEKIVRYTIHRITGFRFTNERNYWLRCGPRLVAYFAFDKKYIKTECNKGKIGSYDYVAIGSDQVWNPNWYVQHPGIEKLFLLEQIPPSKRICMSPSIGVSEIPLQWQKYFSSSWKRFPHIAVREKSAQKLVYELSGKTSQVLIDPTLMIDKEEWQRLEKKPRYYNFEQRYIFTYFLGNVNNKRKRKIQDFASKNNLHVFDFFSLDDKKQSSNGPAEFLYLIKRASIIFTDSYHGCIFSFLFDKPFYVFKREDQEESMMTRIESILELLALPERLISENDIQNVDFLCDYKNGKQILEREREKLKDYIALCMEGE